MSLTNEDVKQKVTFEEFWQIWQTSDKLRFYDLYSRIQKPDDLVPLLERVPKASVDLRLDRPANKSKILVVVPTSDEKSKRSREVSDFFAPYPVLFVVSSGPNFTYSRSCNAGIKEAVKYDPDWIVLCNDDMIFMDPVEVLVNSLASRKPSLYTAMNPDRIDYHGESCLLTKPTTLGIALELMELFLSKNFLGIWVLTNNNIRKKLVRIDLMRSKLTPIKSKFSQIQDIEFVNFADFAVFPPSLAEQFRFDELILSDFEDYDLSLRLYFTGTRIQKLPFRIGTIGGYSMSSQNGTRRFLRQQISRFYLTFKLEKNGILRSRRR